MHMSQPEGQYLLVDVTTLAAPPVLMISYTSLALLT